MYLTLRIFVFLVFTCVFYVNAQTVSPISTEPWSETLVSVYDPDEAARFFKEIGAYKEIWRGNESAEFLSHLGLGEGASATSVLLKASDQDFGMIRLIKFYGVEKQMPTRPGARPWDTGCFANIMVRAKGLDTIYDDAIRMNWWTETPITDLKFGTSSLKIVIFKGPQGIGVEAYERLSPPLPEIFPDFERLSVPFNMMMTVRDRDSAYEFFIGKLGFESFFVGPPVTASEEAQMPLGIPLNQTTTSKYRASILYPKPGEVGRVELVEFMDLDGEDYAHQCQAPNFGILSIKFPVDDVQLTTKALMERGVDQPMQVRTVNLAPYGNIRIFTVKSPDGANIEFYSK